MQMRQLGNNGPWLTEIGLGTWAIGGPWEWGWGRQDDRDSIAAIHAALEAGINWIDTAPAYGLGHAETIIGNAIFGRRDKIFLATKCGLVWDQQNRVTNNNRPESIRLEVEASLRRLQTDYIDLYQIHWPDPATPVQQSWEAMLKLQDTGKVRYVGVSNFNVKLLQVCEDLGHVNSLQPPYSMLSRRVEAEIFPWCREHGIGVVAYSPLQSGLLTGNFDKSRLAGDDWRWRNSYFREPYFSKNLELVRQVKPIAEKYGKTVIHLAIAWALMHPAVTSAIVGARNGRQVQDFLEGSGWQIDPEDMARIDELHGQAFS